MNRMPRWLVAFTAIVLFLMHLPVLVLVAFSFNASKFSVNWTGFTLHWYQRLLEREDILAALRASLIVGLSATVIATIVDEPWPISAAPVSAVIPPSKSSRRLTTACGSPVQWIGFAAPLT